MLALLFAALSGACAPAARAWIAEVFYDAVGDDTGREFVELLNPGPFPVPLAGVRLEAGDGSGPARWTLRWTGGAGDSVPAGGRFVIGGPLVTPPPVVNVTLDLQNGPDAVRLVWPDGAREVVGWGAHEFAEYACGAPAPDVPGGFALARVPDDADGGANAADFRAAAPSPGTPNQVARDVAVVRGSWATQPSRPGAGAPFTVLGRLANAGRDTLHAGTYRVELACSAWPAPLAHEPVDALEPGDTLALALAAALPAGAWVVHVRAGTAGDAAGTNDHDSLRVRAGPPPLAVTEVQFHPAAGEGEWVEVRNATAGELVLDGWALAERSGTRGLVRGGRIPRDSLAVLAQDREGLLARHPTLDTARVLAVAPWGALNNSDDAEGIADVLTVREPDGTFVDALAYSARGVPAGAAIVREGESWRVASPAAGTPLRPPPPPPVLAGRFALARARLAPGEDAAFVWRLPWDRARVTLDLHDLAGRRVRRLLDETDVPAHDVRTLPLGALAPGFYVAALQARDTGGRERLVLRAPLRIAPEAP